MKSNNGEICFLNIFRRLVIKNTILYHLKILNINFHKRVVINSLDGYPYTEYLRSVLLYFGSNSIILNKLIQSLPESVKIIQLCSISLDVCHFIQHIPSNITTLRIGQNQIESLKIPDTLTSLDMGSQFSSLPSSSFFPSCGLVYLNLGDGFNGSLLEGYLPSTLKTLKIGNSFAMKMKDIHLPSSITDLEFGNMFSDDSMSIENLPTGLLKLSLGSSYKSPFKKSTLPKSLTKLKLSEAYTGSIDPLVLPTSITCLKFNYIQPNHHATQISYVPLYLESFVNLKSLQIGARHVILTLPCGPLEKLTTYTTQDFAKIQPQGSLKSIKSYKVLQDQIGLEIPCQVVSLYINHYSIAINDILPSTTRYLSINYKPEYSQKKSKIHQLPSHITSLREQYNDQDFERDYRQLTNLKALGTYYAYENFKLPNNGSLKLLELEYIFNSQEFQMHKVPSSVETLIIKGNTIIKLPLPSNIKSIYVSSTNYYFLNRINFKNEPNLLEIIKVIDNSLDIFEKLSQDL